MAIQHLLRGKQIALEEVKELRVVRADKMMARSAAATSVMRSLKQSARSVKAAHVEKHMSAAFEAAGWVFARNAESTTEAARSLTREPPEQAVRRVFRDADGEMFVETPRVTVALDPKYEPAEAVAKLGEMGLRPLRSLRFGRNLFEVVATDQSDRSLDVAPTVADRSEVAYAEAQLLQRLPARFRPSDPSYPRQWQWNNDGSSGGLAGADVSAEAAWNTTRGAGVRIAVIDNGFQVNHPDLIDGIQGGGFFEDDGMGSGPFVPLTTSASGFPSGNHGTFCLGMVGARLNDVGGCGGAPESMLLPIACLVDQVGTQATLARAVAYAADPTLEDASASASEGADVISCSLGPNGADWLMESVLRDAIDYAVTQGRGGLGTPIFWAVSNGNFPVGRDEVSSYENTIGVGRSSRLDLEDGSAFGPELDFLAPGVEVFSTQQGSRYGSSTGTSYAAPCAASIGGLVLAVDPSLTWSELRDRLRATCDKIGTLGYAGSEFGGRNERYGFGRINAAAAVSASAPESSEQEVG